MVKKILLAILGVIILLVIVGFFLPGTITVSRSAVVNAPAQSSFEEVNDLKQWEKWSYWNTLDPEVKMTYGDTTAGVGAWYKWDGPELGKGKVKITESVPNSSVKVDLDFMEQGTAKAWYTFEPEGDNTKVTMGFSSEFGYNPFMRWIGATIFPSEMNKAFDYNLAKIKEIAEAKPKQ
jgi:hypothetical protein